MHSKHLFYDKYSNGVTLFKPSNYSFTSLHRLRTILDVVRTYNVWFVELTVLQGLPIFKRRNFSTFHFSIVWAGNQCSHYRTDFHSNIPMLYVNRNLVESCSVNEWDVRDNLHFLILWIMAKPLCRVVLSVWIKKWDDGIFLLIIKRTALYTIKAHIYTASTVYFIWHAKLFDHAKI